MRITLTGRRLALAAVLVLGGAAAPLAYASIAGSKPSSMSAASVKPLAAAMPAMARASASVGDNPFQQFFSASNLPDGCHNIPLPAGAEFVLESVLLQGFSGSANPHLYLWQLQPGGGEIPIHGFTIPITNSSWGVGQQAFNLLIRARGGTVPRTTGDILGLGICTNGGSFFVNSSIYVTGQRVAGSSTQAAVADFAARSTRAGTTLRWTTGSETEIAGFNIWRYRGAKAVKINRTLIRARRSGTPAGVSYRYVDQVRGAKRGLTYRLQLVDLKGKRTWYAAFAIASR